jgi:hypothetical protein
MHDPFGRLRSAGKVVLVLVVLAGAWRTWVAPSAERSPTGATSASATSSAREASVVDAEPRLVEMPLVIGADDSFARHLLELTHLRLGRVRLEPSSRPWGSVLSQSIAPGAAVREGTRVDLILAKGSVPQPCRLYWCASGDEPDVSASSAS